MKLLAQAPRGTKDILPLEMHKWYHLEKITAEQARKFGYKEMRTPTFESTKLFVRSVGDTTDVVQKEMYTFSTKDGVGIEESFTLKPEGTAGFARAVLEQGLLNGPLPLKLYYNTSCFRHEKPQAGRLREFHQFGIELYGTEAPSADAEVIAMAKSVFDDLQIQNLNLEINSIGCPECRATYHQALTAYFTERKENLCDTCLERLERNPMRLLDCKNESCKELAKNAPVILDYICEDCREHFESVQQYLNAMDITFIVNPRIVRGLDYYTRTVFEFISNAIGAQGTVCGGGRYDGLMEMLGGKPTPGIGFAMGMERLLSVMEKENIEFPALPRCDVYIGSMGKEGNIKAAQLTNTMRLAGYWAESDTIGRSVKAQMKYADKIGARYSCIIGESELEKEKAGLKNMENGEVTEIAFADFAQAISK